MRTILKLCIIGFGLILISTSCRDKGAYTYSGYLVDSCLNPINYASVFVNAGQTGDRQTYTTANGYFIVSGSWDEPGGLMSKPVQPDMYIQYEVNGQKSSIDIEYLPEGNNDLKRIVLNKTLTFPVVLDRSSYNCANCSFGFTLIQEGNFIGRSNYYSNVDFDLTNPTQITTYMPLQLEINEDKLANPLNLYVYRNDSVHFSYPPVDISDKIKFCSPSDTLFIKL